MSELPPELRRIVEDGYVELAPSAADRERIRRRVLLATSIVATSAPLQGAGASTAGAASSSVAAGSGAVWGLSAVKLLLGTLAVGGIIATGIATLMSMSHERASASIPLEKGASLTVAEAAPGSSPQPTSIVERREPPLPEKSEAPLDSELPRARPPGLAARPTDSGESRLGDTLVGELALLDEARAANASCHSAQALALLRRYEREHPKGQLGPEAAYLRIVVLCRAGSQKLAQAHANAFSEHWPTSTLTSRVVRVCELPEVQEICDDKK